jgi:hypothetical protein
MIEEVGRSGCKAEDLYPYRGNYLSSRIDRCSRESLLLSRDEAEVICRYPPTEWREVVDARLPPPFRKNRETSSGFSEGPESRKEER